MCNFAKQCGNLRELAVAHSSISNHDLAEILVENENITRLSFSIESPETFWLANGFEHPSERSSYDSWADHFANSHLGKCKKTLAKLESLEIYLGQYPVVLGTTLRYV